MVLLVQYSKACMTTSKEIQYNKNSELHTYLVFHGKVYVFIRMRVCVYVCMCVCVYVRVYVLYTYSRTK